MSEVTLKAAAASARQAITRHSTDASCGLADSGAVVESSAMKEKSSGPQTLALNVHKAGMEGLDAEKINEIIKKASEGSRFYQHKQKCQQRLDVKIAEIKQTAAAFSEEQIRKATIQMDQIVKALEESRDLRRTIVHVDMDMFYAAVEMRDNPALRDKPMAVGGTGMLSTSNYTARKFGVRAAMPGFIGKKLCPDLVIVPPDFTKYKQASKEVQEVFAEYDPNFSPMSLDEAYLDITEYLLNHAKQNEDESDEELDHRCLAEQIVAEMREKICAKTKLTASAGIAANTLLAKICSDKNKPNGQFYLPSERQQILDFVYQLPIRKVSGIGNVTEQHLSAIGVTKCSHLMEKRGLLRLLFSEISYNSFIRIALGLGHTSLDVWTEKDRKSISTETTFRGTADKAELFNLIDELCHELAEDMGKRDILGKVFTLKIKTTDFQIKTRAHTLPDYTGCVDVLISTAKRLLQHEIDASSRPLSLRLIGVRMSTLVNSSDLGPNRQTTLTQMFARSQKTVSGSSVKDDYQDFSGNTSGVVCVGVPSKPSVEIGNSESLLESCSKETKEILNAKSKVKKQNEKISVIDHFLPKTKDHPKNSKETYVCPVCNGKIAVDNLNEFNRHVDLCLENSTASSSSELKNSNIICNAEESSSSSVCYSSPTADSIDRESGRYNEHSSDTGNFGRDDGIYTYDDYESEDNLEFATPQDGDDDVVITKANLQDFDVLKEEKNNYVCPVCGNTRFDDINALNEHVDECLNSSAISELLQDESCVQGSSGKNKWHDKVKPPINKPSHTETSGKRKTQQYGKHSKKAKVKNVNTIENYFISS